MSTPSHSLILPSKILIPEQAEAIFSPLCCAKPNRLNEQARNKPSHLNGFYMWGYFKTAQQCWPNWLVKSACCLHMLYFTSVYIGHKTQEDISTPCLHLKYCVCSHSLAKIMIKKTASKRHINAGFYEWQIEIDSVCLCYERQHSWHRGLTCFVFLSIPPVWVFVSLQRLSEMFFHYKQTFLWGTATDASSFTWQWCHMSSLSLLCSSQ